MKKFFARNIDARGQRVRGALGGLLIIGGIVACRHNLWLGMVLIVSGGFCLFEAVRGLVCHAGLRDQVSIVGKVWEDMNWLSSDDFPCLV